MLKQLITFCFLPPPPGSPPREPNPPGNNRKKQPMAARHRAWVPKAESRQRRMKILNHLLLQVAWDLVAKLEVLSFGATMISTILHNAWTL